MSNSKIVERIRKLLALSKSDNQHEAELALIKANELMEEHQIKMADTFDPKAKSIIIEQLVNSKRAKWVASLALSCASLFDCKLLVNSSDATKLTFVGTHENIQNSIMTFEFLIKAWETIANNDFETYRRIHNVHGKSFKSSHGSGYSFAIGSRCSKLIEERKKKVFSHSNGTALIVANEQAMTEHLSKYTKSAKIQYNNSSVEGFISGYDAGNKVNLGKNLS